MAYGEDDEANGQIGQHGQPGGDRDADRRQHHRLEEPQGDAGDDGHDLGTAVFDGGEAHLAGFGPIINHLIRYRAEENKPQRQKHYQDGPHHSDELSDNELSASDRLGQNG